MGKRALGDRKAENLIEVGVGYSTLKDSYQAGLAASKDALSQIMEHEVSVVILFTSSRFDLEKLAQGVKEVADDAIVIGTTTAGEIADRRLENSVVVVVLASPFISVNVGIGTNVAKDWRSAVEDVIKSSDVAKYFQKDYSIWANLTRNGKNVFGLLFSPGATLKADSQNYLILQELISRSESKIPFFGGASADDWKLEENHVILNGKVYPNSILLAVFETSLSFGIGMAHGYEASDEKFRVTKIEGQEILEIDNKPAVKVLSEIFDFKIEEIGGMHLGFLTTGTIGYQKDQGDYVLNIPSRVTSRQGVILSHAVPQGIELTVMKATKKRLAEASKNALRRANLRAGISKPAICITFSCALRAAILDDEADNEIQSMKEAAPKTPIVGFYSFGEQTISNDGTNEHFNEIISVLSIGNSLSPSAEVALENKQLLRELKITEEAQRALLIQMPDAVIATDEDGVISHWNPKAEEILGYSEEYCIGKILEDVLSDSAQELLNLIKTENCGIGYSSELYILASNGTKIPFLVTASHNRNQPYFTDVYILHDIRHRIEMRNALLDSEEKYRNLIENSLEGIAIATDNKFLFVNTAFSKLMGRSIDELLSKRMPAILHFIHPEDVEKLTILNDVWQKERTVPDRVEFRVITDTGETKWIECYPQTIMYDDVPAIQMLAHDITIRKNVMNSLEKERTFFQTLAEVSVEDDDIQSICRRILETLMRNYDFHLGAIQLYDEKNNLLELVAAQGVSPYKTYKHMKVAPIEETGFIASHVAYSKEPIYITDSIPEAWPKIVEQRFKELRVRSSMTYPILRSDSSLIGIVNFASKKSSSFSSYDKQFYQAAISMLGTAIEKAEAKQKLVESKELFEKTFISQRDSILILSKSNPPIVVDCNPMANEVFGYPRNELIGSAVEILAPDDSSGNRLIHQLTHNIKRRGFIQIPDFVLESKTGKKLDTEITAVLLQKDSGGDMGSVVVIRDITKEKQDEQALIESEQRYKTVLQSLNDLVFVFDEENRYTQFYSASGHLLAVSKEEFIGKQVDEVLDNESSRILLSTLDRVRETGENGNIEYELEINGEVRYFSGSVSLQDDGKHCTLIVRDVTERKLAENELLTSYRDLELYTSLLRHDIANDLQIIMAQSGMLEKNLGDINRERTEAIFAAAERMGRVLSVFGASENEPKQTLLAMIEKISDQAKRAHPGLIVNIECTNHAKSINLSIGRLIPLAFDNLLRNAATFAGENPVVDIKIRKSQNTIIIDFKDNGDGIPTHIHDNLFQRGTSTTGGGLGLYLTKRVLEGHGASIELIKDKHKGTHFRVVFPIQ
ncbi:MAG: PAS domain S-box protein [Candidatus Lokiarchaeota archaeon]|nr:PAS domain S-box protein [Candidatus Lokiarchaeota archaeon]